jgi:Flp pilus assembly protein TadG
MWIRARLKFLAKEESGVAAVEMGLIAPLLAIALVLMLDVGIAVAERMELDRDVRAGAHMAMSQVNEPDAIKNIIVASAGGAQNLLVAVDKTCSCGGAVVQCTSWCSAQEPPSVFINIRASKPHSGLIMPAFSVGSQTRVQLR